MPFLYADVIVHDRSLIVFSPEVQSQGVRMTSVFSFVFVVGPMLPGMGNLALMPPPGMTIAGNEIKRTRCFLISHSSPNITS